MAMHRSLDFVGMHVDKHPLYNCSVPFQIITRYDVVVIQEIVDRSNETIDGLLAAVNSDPYVFIAQ